MKQEKLPWLANNPFYTKRFADYVGRRCWSATVRDVARELRLDWKTVKALEMEYMREQLRRAGTPGPKVIGIDELSIGRGHNYRIVVSDLVRGRPIWFGGTDRSEKSMDLFFQWLGPRKCQGIRLAVMDMWKPFRNSTLKAGNAPQAGILYDKFHVRRERRGSSAGATPARQLSSLQPVAIGAAVEATKPPKPSMQRVASATLRAGRP